MKANQATAEVFFTAFKALDTSVREAFFEKILKNRRIREDLMDAALIDEAKKVKGKPVSAKDYFAKRRKTGDAALPYCPSKRVYR